MHGEPDKSKERPQCPQCGNRLRVLADQIGTTVRCPKEQVVLAGSMTYDVNADSDQPDLYLFVKVAVHTITEDKSDWDANKKLPAKND